MGIGQKIYNNSPIPLQNFACTIKGLKEKRVRLGKNFEKYYHFLLESQFWSAKQIEDYQNEKLNFIIKYAYENTDYYRELIDSLDLSPNNFTTISDLEKLPILTKEIVQERHDSILAKDFQGKQLSAHTSGSTGKALHFVISEDAVQYRWALWFRHKSRFGAFPDDAYATFTGLPVIPINQKNPPYWRENWAMKQTIFTMHHISPEKTPSVVERLNRGGFVYYTGYPSILYNLATLIQDQNLKMISFPKVIFTGAEALYEDQKERISEVFNCKVTDQYGFSEAAGNASKCENDLYHEDFEYGILEIQNKQKNNEIITGDIIATGFTNLAMPFIRYEVGDIGTWSGETCGCNRNTRILKGIEGRNEDYVLTPEGNKILRFDYIFKDTSDIKEAQVLQYKNEEITIKIVKREKYSMSTETFLVNSIKEKISDKIIVNFDYVDQIAREENGKFRAVKSFLKEV